MPDGRVSIEIATEAAQTLAAWRALQSEVKKTTAELTAAKKAGGDAGEATAKGAHGAHAALQHVTGEAHAAHGALGTLTEGAHEATEAFAEHAMQSVLGFTSVAGAVGLVVEGLKEAILAQQELNNERNKAAVVEAASGTRFEIATIASGLHRETREAILEKSKEVSANFGIMPEEAEKLATLAAKEHVDVQQIPEVLESAHRFAASQGETLTPAMLKDFIDLVKLQNENSKATAEGARDMFHAAGGAMLAHPLSHADLGAFKAAAPEMRRAGLSVDEQLAFFGTAKQRLGGDAGTAASFTTTFLDKLVSQRGAGKMKAEGLMALGLDLQNVDLKGEDLQEVLDRLAGGLAKLDEAAKLPALGKIFGAGNALKAQEVIENRGDFAQFLQENAQAAPLAETAATRLTQTDAARIARAKARQEKEAAAHGDPAVETARAVMEEMLEETNANAVQRFAARRMFQFAGGTQGIEEWLKGQKLNPEQQRAQATQRAMASVEFAVDMKPEQTAEMAGRMGLLDREPEEERGAVAARQRGGQSDLIGPERLEAAADKKKLAGEMKKRDTERKQNATELAHAEKALADFGERQELHEALDEARKLDDEENQDEQEAFKRRQRAVSDDEFRQRHPAKARPKGLTDAEWMKRQAGMFRPAEHVELAHPKATHTHAEAVQAGELAAQLREKEEAVAAAKAAVEEGRKQKERDDKQNALLERIAKGVERRDDPNRAKARPPL